MDLQYPSRNLYGENIQQHQPQLNMMRDAMENEDTARTEDGKRTILPPTFFGDIRYMYQNYIKRIDTTCYTLEMEKENRVILLASFTGGPRSIYHNYISKIYSP